MTTTTRLAVRVRWLIERDMPAVLAIENAAFEFPWSREDFLSCLRQRNCIGMVAELPGQQIAGYMVYELHQGRFVLLSMAVDPVAWRRDVGTQMMRTLIDKLSQQRRNEILLEVRETNLAAQLFFRSQGFRAVSVLRNQYDDTTEDAYVMQYRLDREAVGQIPRNRLSVYAD